MRSTRADAPLGCASNAERQALPRRDVRGAWLSGRSALGSREHRRVNGGPRDVRRLDPCVAVGVSWCRDSARAGGGAGDGVDLNSNAPHRARDIRALRAVIDDERLTEGQLVMLQDMESSLARFPQLTDRQREIVDSILYRLDLGADVDDHVGMNDAQRARAAQLGPMKLDAAGPMVLRPPGRGGA